MVLIQAVRLQIPTPLPHYQNELITKTAEPKEMFFWPSTTALMMIGGGILLFIILIVIIVIKSKRNKKLFNLKNVEFIKK